MRSRGATVQILHGDSEGTQDVLFWYSAKSDRPLGCKRPTFHGFMGTNRSGFAPL